MSHHRLLSLTLASVACSCRFLCAEDTPPLVHPTQSVSSVSTDPDHTTPVQTKTVHTAEQTVSAETLIVTASRREEVLDRATASVDVITVGDAHDRGFPLWIPDLLRGLPGVDVLNTGGGIAGNTDIRLRGATSSETRYLIDNIPLNDPAGISGNPQATFLNTAGFERLEIVRGAQSGYYGSNATGGVINVLSARPTATPEESVRVEGGSFHTVRGDVQATGPLGDNAGFAVSANGLSSDGFSIQTSPGAHGDAGGHEKDGVKEVAATTRLEGNHGPAHGYVGFSAQKAEQDLDFTGPDDSTNTATLSTWRASGGGTFALDKNWQTATDAAYTVYNRAYPNEALYDKYFDTNDTYASVRETFTGVDHLSATLGVDGDWQHAKTTEADGSVAINEGVRLIGVWAAAHVSLDNSEWSLTGRHDEHSREGGADTFRAAAAWFAWNKQLKLFSSAGTGFRAPSVYELYAPFSGNVNTKAQTANSFDGGAAVGNEGLKLTSTVFYTRYRNLITFDNFFNTINLPTNSHIVGVENALRSRSGHLPVEAGVSYTWQHSDDGTGAPLRLLPDNKASADALYRWRMLWLRAQLDRVWGRSYGAGRLAPYMLLGASAGWIVTQHWELYVRGENLSNEEYEVYPGYSTARISGYAGAMATF